MKSIDTNIFLYAANRDSAEYKRAFSFINDALKEPSRRIIADQTYFELYRILRNSAVLQKPLSARDASGVIKYYRMDSGFLHCAYRPEIMGDVLEAISKKSFPAARTFDLIPALTLRDNGVKELYTRNKKDFVDFKRLKVIDPLADNKKK